MKNSLSHSAVNFK